MPVVGSCGNTCTAPVAVQAIDVSKKLFSHRQNKQTPQAIVHKVVVVC